MSKKIDDDLLPAEGVGREEMEELYSWSFNDACAAMGEFDKFRPLRLYTTEPIIRWFAAQRLKYWFGIFTEGKKEAILKALSICSMHSFPIPQWCARAYLEAFKKVASYKTGSWDDVFGKPLPKGKHLEAKRKYKVKGPLVYQKIKQIKNANPSIPIDASLFETVGKELGISKTTAGRYYYEEIEFRANFFNSLK